MQYFTAPSVTTSFQGISCQKHCTADIKVCQLFTFCLTAIRTLYHRIHSAYFPFTVGVFKASDPFFFCGFTEIPRCQPSFMLLKLATTKNAPKEFLWKSLHSSLRSSTDGAEWSKDCRDQFLGWLHQASNKTDAEVWKTKKNNNNHEIIIGAIISNSKF